MTDAAKAWQAKWGGFVHPHPVLATHGGSFYDATPGMTLRDHFAGLALQGILAGRFADTVPHDDIGGGFDAAHYAYQYADAMIAARGGV